MCEIKDWMMKHPAISVRWMEKELEIPLGTIRVSGTKPIPEKYWERIRSFLEGYGMLNSYKSVRKQYFLKNGRLLTKENGLFVRKEIGENVPLYLE